MCQDRGGSGKKFVYTILFLAFPFLALALWKCYHDVKTFLY